MVFFFLNLRHSALIWFRKEGWKPEVLEHTECLTLQRV